MGKKKQPKQKKDVSVFKVAGSRITKSKHKPKPVTTNLKKINSQTKSETLSVDSALADIRESMITSKKQKEESHSNETKAPVPEVPNVDAALKDFSKL